MQKVLLFLATVFIAQLAMAETIFLDKNKSNVPYSVEVLNANAVETVIRLRLNQIEREVVSTENGEYVSLTVRGTTATSQKGFPELPKISRNILIPLDAEPSLKVTHYNSQKMELGIVAPNRGTIYRNQNPAEVPYVPGPFYTRKSGENIFPSVNVSLKESFQWRDVKGISFEINPLSYNSATGETEVINDLIFTIKNNSKAKKYVTRNQSSHVNVFRKMYSTHFLNWDDINSDATVIIPNSNQVSETGDLLIISADKFASQLGNFVKWKEKMGYRTSLVKLSDIGTDHNDIYGYIKKTYKKNSSLGFVILVGDSDTMPFHPGVSGNALGNEADPMYGLMEGDDSYPELIIARFSVQTKAELENIVNRSINYEKKPTPGQWYKNATGIASDEGEPTDYERADLLKDELLSVGFKTVDEHYAPGVGAHEVSQSLDKGRGIINYIGHGTETSWITSWFENSDIRALKNYNKLPMIISVACVNGHFDYQWSDSFAEVWMKAGTASKPTGAIAIFASSTNQSWVPPTVGQLKIAEMIAAGDMHTIGGLMVNGSVAVLEDGDATAEQTFETWHIFGDPTIRLRTTASKKISNDIPKIVDSQKGTLEWNLDEADLHVSITKDNKFIASAVTNNEGKAIFKDLVNLEGSYEVTISGANRSVKESKIIFK